MIIIQGQIVRHGELWRTGNRDVALDNLTLGSLLSLMSDDHFFDAPLEQAIRDNPVRCCNAGGKIGGAVSTKGPLLRLAKTTAGDPTQPVIHKTHANCDHNTFDVAFLPTHTMGSSAGKSSPQS